MKTRNGAVLVVGTLVCILAGCNSSEYKAQKTGGEEQMKMIQPGQALKPPTGAPGLESVGTPMRPPMTAPGGQPGMPMQPPTGAPGR